MEKERLIDRFLIRKDIDFSHTERMRGGGGGGRGERERTRMLGSGITLLLHNLPRSEKGHLG